MSFHVECIGSADNLAPTNGIRTVGGIRPDGTPWRLSEPDAISGIETGSWCLHVEGPNGELVPLVVDMRAGKKYLKAELDAVIHDPLLSLPECTPVNLDTTMSSREPS